MENGKTNVDTIIFPFPQAAVYRFISNDELNKPKTTNKCNSVNNKAFYCLVQLSK